MVHQHFFVLIAIATVASGSGSVKLSVSWTSEAVPRIEIAVNDSLWVRSGLVVFRHGATWFSSDCNTLIAPMCGQLTAGPIQHNDGEDAVGLFKEEAVTWTPVAFHAHGAIPVATSTVTMTTSIRTYTADPTMVSFVQTFPQGLHPNNSHGSMTEIVSAFPSIASTHLNLGIVWYEGVQLQNTRFLHWPAGALFPDVNGAGTSTKSNHDGGGMPLVLISETGSTVVASPLEDFFTATQTPSEKLGNFSFGLQGTLTQAPEGYTHATLMVAGGGVRSTLMHWGDAMIRAANSSKIRPQPTHTDQTTELGSLSYYSDNGAYYYYQTANGTCNGTNCCEEGVGCGRDIEALPKDATGYQATFTELVEYFTHEDIPVRSIQFDSWWYYKGPHSGVQLWEPMPSTLGGMEVNGDPATWYKLPSNISTTLHSRFFEAQNEYVKGTAPGMSGPFDWTPNCGNIAVSRDVKFFRHIFSRAKQGLGMRTYEQDFLTASYENCNELSQTPGAAKAWLTAMAAGASAENITIQYCMALPRHILQTVNFPEVTHARASHDYGQSRSDDSEQWSSLGMTAMLYWSLGLVPFKDDYWTTAIEPGNHWHSSEAQPELQNLVSSLMAGPVGPADKLGLLNRTRVMRTCTAEGVLLKPLAPAMNIDASFIAQVNSNNADNKLGINHVWLTAMGSTVGGTFQQTQIASHYVAMFANVSTRPVTLEVEQLSTVASEGTVSQSSEFVAREFYSGRIVNINHTSPLVVQPRPKPTDCSKGGYLSQYCVPFELWTIAPAMPYTLLGEIDKYISVSPQRFSNLMNNGSASLGATIHGSAGEDVNLGIMDLSDGGPSRFIKVLCHIPSAGTVQLSCSSTAGTCTCE